MFNNFYEHCDTEWTMTWSCACNDKCPDCGKEIEPFHSREVTLSPCHKCGDDTEVDLLDAKDDGSGNFTILHCQSCYGPGWSPLTLK